MTKLIVTASAILMSLLSFSQVSENRNVSDFSKLKASHGIEVSYTVSNTKSVKVETDDNEKMKFIKTEVEGSTLKIFVDSGDGNYKSSKKGKGKRTINGIRFSVLKVTVSGPSLQAIKASSSADIKIQNANTANNVDIEVSSSGSISGKFNCDKIDIDASSSGNFKGDIDAKNVAVESSSSADVHLNGKTEKLTVKSSSSSTCDADKLIADDVVATASSSADINLYVQNSLNAKASSSGDINYKGNPSQVTKDQSSSGSVNHK
ncbi:MAG: head GIN domain-containing protein [Flavobacterium sp.]